MDVTPKAGHGRATMKSPASRTLNASSNNKNIMKTPNKLW